MTAPGFNDIMRSAGDTWDTIPDAPLPYHIAGRDGLFLHRRLAFGRGVVQEKFFPDNWKNVGGSRFNFEANPIPAEIIGKIVSFFQRIYEKQQTEAAVLLTMNTQTKEWGVYVPTQMVSHGGVNYVFDPSHIKAPRIIVGSIHSHADFSPFHSGTDTNDAADFDGFHCTVGYVNTKPQIVAMVAMNKEFMHYKEADFPGLFDWSGVGQYEAPLWWDRYVGRQGSSEKPTGFDLFAKFQKPIAVREERKQTVIHGPWKRAGSEDRDTRTNSSRMQSDWSRPSWYDYEDNWYTAQNLRESERFNAKKEAERGVSWRKDGSLSKKIADAEDMPFWEDGLPDDFVALLTASGFMGEELFEFCLDAPEIARDPSFWKEWVVRQSKELTELAKTLDVDLNFTVAGVEPEQPSIWLLPEPKAKEATHGIR